MIPTSCLEKRRFDRFSVPHESLLIVSQQSPQAWVVNDISKGGLSFDYTPPLDLKQNASLDLFWYTGSYRRHHFHFNAIPFRTVYDIKLEPASGRTGFPEIRRCGLQFNKLGILLQGKLSLVLGRIKRQLPFYPH